MGTPVQNGHPVQLGGVFDAIRSVLIKRPAVTFVAAHPDKGHNFECGFMKPLFQRHQCGSAFMHGATPTDRPGWRPKNFPVLQRRCFGPGGNKLTFRIKGFDSVNDLIGIRKLHISIAKNHWNGKRQDPVANVQQNHRILSTGEGNVGNVASSNALIIQFLGSTFCVGSHDIHDFRIRSHHGIHINGVER